MGALRRVLHRKSGDWALALGLTLLFFAAFMLLYGMRYEVNDDAIISNIAAGAYGGQSQYLVYVNLLFGLFLKPFYAVFPQLNWFVVFLVLGGLYCFTQLGVLLLRAAGLLAGSCLFSAFLLCAGGEFFVYFHYGRYAGLFLVTGLLLLAQNLGRFHPLAIWGLALAVLGSLLRFQIFVAVGALVAPLLLWRFFALSKREKLRAAVLVAALLALAAGLWGLDAAIYRANPAWASYWRFNRVRTEISDFRLQFAQDRSAFHESHGYTDVDVEMMEKWAYYDAEVFSAEKLEAFTGALPNNTVGGAVKSFVRTAAGMLYQGPFHLLFGALLAAWLCLGRCKNGRVVLATGGMLLLEVFYLSYRGRLPQRIDFALVLAALCFVAAAWQWPRGPRPAPQPQSDVPPPDSVVTQNTALPTDSASPADTPPPSPAAEATAISNDKKPFSTPAVKNRCAALALLVLCLASLPALQTRRAEMQDYWQSHLPRAAEIDALSADKNHLYLLDTYLVDAANGFTVWRPRGKDYFSNMVFVGSWLMESPFQAEALQRYGLQNPYRDAVDKPEVLLADYYYRQLKEDYLRHHYGEDICIELVAEYGDFNLYRIVRIKE